MSGGNTCALISNSPEQTVAAGKLLGGLLNPGDVIALVGELGAGKTVLTKGIAAGLGFEQADLVTSPTYKVLNQYRGRVIINHFDAYRLEGPDDFADIGGEDMLEGSAVSIIEWAERIAQALPQRAVRVLIRVLSESRRKLEFTFPEESKSLAAALSGQQIESG